MSHGPCSDPGAAGSGGTTTAFEHVPATHCSGVATKWSPHSQPQVPVTQTQPGSAVQRSLQPSPETEFPSSQASLAPRSPSPHVEETPSPPPELALSFAPTGV